MRPNKRTQSRCVIGFSRRSQVVEPLALGRRAQGTFAKRTLKRSPVCMWHPLGGAHARPCETLGDGLDPSRPPGLRAPYVLSVTA